MGSSSSKKSQFPFLAIPDSFATIEQLKAALAKCNIENCEVLWGYDFTKSNTWQGKESFGGKCLHDLSPGRPNPYQLITNLLARTVKSLDNDDRYTAFGFGDLGTKNTHAFPFRCIAPAEGKGSDIKIADCQGMAEMAQAYSDIVPAISLCGGTSFAPIIQTMRQYAKEKGGYHIGFILTDGVIDLPEDRKATAKAIVDASFDAALSIVCIGVGDGPFDLMREFDDKLPERQFDNFQFVDSHEIMPRYTKVTEKTEAELARRCLMEIPDQYLLLKGPLKMIKPPQPGQPYPYVKFFNFKLPPVHVEAEPGAA